MLKNSKEFSKLKIEWKKNWKNKIVDIFIFGSSVKGKLDAGDIDICVVFRYYIDLNITKKISSVMGEKYHVSSLVVDSFFTNPHSLSRTLLLEGKSIMSNKPFAEQFGLSAKLLYYYDLSKEKQSKKVLFVHLLRGRNGSEGFIKKLGGEFISNSAFIMPIAKDHEIQEVFAHWKIKYNRMKLMLMR